MYEYDRKDYYDNNHDKHDKFKKLKCYFEEQDDRHKYEDKYDYKHNDKNCITINIIFNHAETGGQISSNGGQNANQGGQIAKKGGQNANQDGVVVKKHDKKNKDAKVKKYF
ncbi:hypothetical protein [Priestia endophytica]|uniref:hypothetical protein n=1 Tax=Priestia endophytica TaxID=135735 RepID=UPI00203DF468|nr:hypothetical protein [Priestia endophytica]MCM3541174.1 hypothetical protein [Priestia endophytica]